MVEKQFGHQITQSTVSDLLSACFAYLGQPATAAHA